VSGAVCGGGGRGVPSVCLEPARNNISRPGRVGKADPHGSPSGTWRTGPSLQRARCKPPTTPLAAPMRPWSAHFALVDIEGGRRQRHPGARLLVPSLAREQPTSGVGRERSGERESGYLQLHWGRPHAGGSGETCGRAERGCAFGRDARVDSEAWALILTRHKSTRHKTQDTRVKT